tara:strand:+ start:34350 stop:36512 length:2163 start_codon:yes stop_codon:yes gene_type:complete
MASIDIPNACSTSRNEPVGTTSLEGLSCNLGHIDRVANSSELTDTNRRGVVTDTLRGALNKLGVLFDNPIRNITPNLVVNDLRAHRFPADTGDIYIPTAPLPFTTGASGSEFDTDDWVLLQGVTSQDLINDLSQTYNFNTVAEYEAFTTVFPAGKKVYLADRKADFTVISGTGTADTFGVIASDEVSQSAAIVVNYNVTAEQFGASTSLTDNSGAINAALASAATVISSLTELQIQATIEIPTGKQCDGLKLFTDGDTFTSSVMPVSLVVNETFGTLATADKNVHFVNGSIRVSNNTATLNPKLIMLGGVIGGHIKNNDLIVEGLKHSSMIECFKSTEDIWIEDNRGKITTGDVTGGGIWLANRTSNEVSKNIHVNNNVVEQDSIDEIMAVFPAVGPMQNIRINNNTLTRLNTGASDGPILRIFCADGLGGGAATATLTDVKGSKNTLNQLRTNNVVSGVMQIGNASADNNDPTDVSFSNTTIKGYFPSATIALRFDFNATAVDVSSNNAVIENIGSFDTNNQGIVDPAGGVVIRDGSVKNFGINVSGYDVEGVKTNLGSVGVRVLGRAVNNECIDHDVPMRVISMGAGVSQLVKGNELKANNTKRCLQLDATSDVMENLRLEANNLDGSNGAVTAITKLGTNAITATQTSGNNFSTVTTLWTNTLGMMLDRNTYAATITNPVGNISANTGSVFWNPSGGAGATLYVKETSTGNTGWVAK